MAKSAKTIFDRVVSRSRGLDLYVKKMERLYRGGSISRVDIERVYAGSFILFYTVVERAIESLFIGLLTGRLVSDDSSVRPLIRVNSDRVAHAVVRGGRSYVDWLPYEQHTKRRAEAFFSQGKPFANLDRSDIRAYESISTVRNALAHESSSAMRKFHRDFTENKVLPPEQRRPAGYLRGQHAMGQTRLNLLFSEAVLSIRNLCR